MSSNFTRLIHIPSGSLENHTLGETPPYIAISHTWADKLFEVRVPFTETTGRRAIEILIPHSHAGISHCWIDTLCIDQDDPEDKHRQIPLMGQIYGSAEAVAILVNQPFGLTQAKVDKVLGDVQGAVEMSTNGTWLDEGNIWTSEAYRKKLKKAMDILELFTRPAWGTRVWTIQEFVLAKTTIWIGSDLQPLKIDERFFQAIPDVCDYLSIEECLSQNFAKYSKLYTHFQGMAGAHLGMIESTRIMELLGNRKATVPEDEIFGVMAASGVIIEDTKTKGREIVWALWWEKAIQTGHLRWALLPPTTPIAITPSISHNCIMPAFSVRHLASSGSSLDSVEGYGPFSVKNGTVSMTGFWAGFCKIICKLGHIYEDPPDLIHRDITIILFASDNWVRAQRVAAAFGAGRFNLKQRLSIAQVLKFNYYRAKLAVLSKTAAGFRPRFRNEYQAFVWSDFMLLQSSQMRVMNHGMAFLAHVKNNLTGTDIVIVTDGEIPCGALQAIDFGAVNEGGMTFFTITRQPDNLAPVAGTSLHRVGVSMALQVTESIQDAMTFSRHILDGNEMRQYEIGGDRCTVCPTLPPQVASQSEQAFPDLEVSMTAAERKQKGGYRPGAGARHRARMMMRRQNRALSIRWKKRYSVGWTRAGRLAK